MARRALQPGELGNITTTKVSKQGRAWTVNPDGTHWRASVLIGHCGDTPKRIRTIATSKRQAVRQCEEQAKQHIDDAKRASGVITGASTPREVWDAYARSRRHQALAPATRRNYETAIADSQHENPHWWNLPLNEAITVSALTTLYDGYVAKHGCGRARTSLRAALGVALKLASDAINLSPFHATRPTDTPITNPVRARLDTDRILPPEEMRDLVTALERYDAKRIPERDAVDALVLQAHLGLRAGELFSLAWGNIDLREGTVRGVESRKTHRTYPDKTLPEWQADRLRARAKKATRTGKDVRLFDRAQATMYRECRLLLNKVGHPGLSIHGIRKSVGSIVFDTYGARAAAAWLAHANVQTTIAYYVKLDGAMPEGPVDLLNRGEQENRQQTGNAPSGE
jgi:integrase